VRHFVIGDIHGMLNDLISIYKQILPDLKNDDILIFCGDYIDRGDDVYGTVEYLYEISKRHAVVFLTGNHELMLSDYLKNKNMRLYFQNGGGITVKSFTERTGSFHIPLEFYKILFSRIYYYETDNFFVVHGGFDPEIANPKDTSEFDMVWIRDRFIKSPRIWQKKIIFGHTPTHFIGLRRGEVFRDDKRNIIGIDTGAVYGGRLTCFVPEEDKIYQSIR
jgi:serine/threonine protein phosphatase 1